MRVLGKKIIVQRGETFTLSCKVYKDDGVTPYILSSTIENPYIVITISSNTFNVNGRYRLNSWLDLSEYPSFRSLTPAYLSDENLEQQQLPEDANKDGKDTVYYTQDSNGNKSYYYWRVTGHDDEGNPTTGQFDSYSFEFHKYFLHTITKDWIESQYQYEFRLVGGQDTTEILTNMYQSVYPDRMWVPTDNRTLYDEIVKCRPDLVKDLRWSAPLTNYSTVDTLQRPQLLIIKPNC